MVVRICERCQQAYSIGAHVTDYVHACSSGNATLDNEDIVIIGSWEDYTGSKTIADGNVPFQGSANKLFGTRAAIEGEVTQTLTNRGHSVQTHRIRQHLEWKDFKGGDI